MPLIRDSDLRNWLHFMYLIYTLFWIGKILRVLTFRTSVDNNNDNNNNNNNSVKKTDKESSEERPTERGKCGIGNSQGFHDINRKMI